MIASVMLDDSRVDQGWERKKQGNDAGWRHHIVAVGHDQGRRVWRKMGEYWCEQLALSI